MAADYVLEKSVWDDGDFERMGWHDVAIHGIAFGPGEFELSLDLDYIFEWVRPAPGETFFRFWVAPCTLVFENVWELRLAMEGDTTLEIAEVRRSDPRRPKNAEHVGKEVEWLWTLACQGGEISFRSVGFTLFVRRAPFLTGSQTPDAAQRGAISFEARSFRA